MEQVGKLCIRSVSGPLAVQWMNSLMPTVAFLGRCCFCHILPKALWLPHGHNWHSLHLPTTQGIPALDWHIFVYFQLGDISRPAVHRGDPLFSLGNMLNLWCHPLWASLLSCRWGTILCIMHPMWRYPHSSAESTEVASPMCRVTVCRGLTWESPSQLPLSPWRWSWSSTSWK